MKKIFCLIPARSGSKRVKNKNIKKLKGQELFLYTIKFAKKINLTHICFSTDSKKYLSLARKHLMVNKLRPKILSGDTVKTYDVFKYELLKEEKRLQIKFDYLLLLQPTVPYRKISDYKKSLKLISSKNCDSVVTLNSVEGYHPERMKVIKKGYAKNYTNKKNENMKPIQKLNKVYLRSGSIYLIKRNAFFKYQNMLGKQIKPIIVTGKYSINIDNENDFVSAEKFN
tara:strand:- start:169 stop:849 length:681 start_codon:yes stop_codon:yes gene_type:complete